MSCLDYTAGRLLLKYHFQELALCQAANAIRCAAGCPRQLALGSFGAAALRRLIQTGFGEKLLSTDAVCFGPAV